MAAPGMRYSKGVPVLPASIRTPVSFCALILMGSLAAFSATPRRTSPTMLPQCRQVTLSASFLAEEKPGDGSGFFLQIHNETKQSLQLPSPVPVSVHWYTQKGRRLLWRASSGSGGSLVNALNEHGPVLAAQLLTPPASYITIAAGQSYQWPVFARQDPAVRYRPDCEHCNYLGEEQFRAVVAYAVEPLHTPDAPQMLSCGLRSAPIVMPPFVSSAPRRNSVSGAGFESQ